MSKCASAGRKLALCRWRKKGSASKKSEPPKRRVAPMLVSRPENVRPAFGAMGNVAATKGLSNYKAALDRIASRASHNFYDRVYGKGNAW